MAGPEVPFPLFLKTSVPPQAGPDFAAIRYPGDGDIVHVTATGMNPTSGYSTNFYIGPELVYPPRLHFANIPPSGIALQVLTPFKTEFLYSHPSGLAIPGIPEPADEIIIYTASGAVTVPVRDANIVQAGGDLVPWPWKTRMAGYTAANIDDVIADIAPEDKANLQLHIAAFKSLKCTLCAVNPIYWQAVGAIKIARQAGLIHSGDECKDILGNAEKLSAILSQVLPGQGALIAAIVSFGVGACKECACDQVF